MAASSSDQSLSSLNFEVNIIRAKNIDFNNKSSSSGDLFVRCYLSSGNNNQRVQLNTKEIPSSPSSSTFDHDLFWNECFSLECLGNERSISSLRQEGNVVFELRWRRSNNASNGSFLGKFLTGGSNSSKVLGTAQIPWKNVFESTNIEIETWVPLISSKNHSKVINQDVKPPKLQVRMKVEVPKKKIIETRRCEEKESPSSSSCGCKDGCGCNGVDYIDYDFFGLGFALDTFED
ncbi:OLC1v1009267C2 [Oldenlandia corymbosa var. corymbosa]|nr:OLC1v1009267C2 [Oldenlandia corymbosa var. corymbosa]